MNPAPSEPQPSPDGGVARAEVGEAGPVGVATPPPFGFVLVLWVGLFFAIAWGFRVLFSRLAAPRAEAADPTAGLEDVTLDEPRRDGS